MKNLAGGSGFLGGVAFLVTILFYFQPTVGAVALANNSPNDTETQFNNQSNFQDTFNDQNIQTDLIQQQQQKQARIPAKPSSSDKKITKTAAVSNFRATAYCLRGRTATGGNVRRGIVAADPRVLPLGSRIQITAGGYTGIYTVTDTGGAVKGRKLDIWVPSCSEARQFGNRSIIVSRL